MIDDKILIFFPRMANINAGGPAGFLAHNLQDKPREVFILAEDLFVPYNFMNKLFYRVRRFMDRLETKTGNHKEFFKIRDYFYRIKASKYKYIFFHEDVDFYCVQDLINEQQVVIFQPHCPQLHSEEYADYAPNDIEKIEMIKHAERAVFERANIVVLPNEGCKSIYQSLYTSQNIFYYLLSGAKSSYNDSQQRVVLPTSRETINLMYIGRRNNIKGFDIVLDAFRKARKIKNNLHLFIVGSGEKIEEEGITDIGFSSQPLSWYHSVDYLLNANRQSYFDLSIIEALSTGVPVIMSHNFGHEYYYQKSSLIQTYDVQQKDALYNILIGDLKKRDYNNQENTLLYLNELTDEHYYDRFKKFYENVFSMYN